MNVAPTHLGAGRRNWLQRLGPHVRAAYAPPTLGVAQPDRAAVDANLPDMRRDLELLDAGDARSELLAGAELSLADLFVAPIDATRRRGTSGGPSGTLRKRPSFGVAHAALM